MRRREGVRIIAEGRIETRMDHGEIAAEIMSKGRVGGIIVMIIWRGNGVETGEVVGIITFRRRRVIRRIM